MRQLPLHSALVWHSYLLLGICGILAALWSLPAGFTAILLLWLDRRLWRWQRLAFGIAVFAAAFAYSYWQLSFCNNAIASPPAWLQLKGQRICGDVAASQGLPDNRLRVLLANTGPSGGAPLPGLCAWTWEKPLFEPLRGQRVCFSRPVRSAGSFANYDEDSYIASLFARNILWRAWSEAGSGNPELLGQPDFGAGLREDLRQAFLRALWPAALTQSAPGFPQDKAILLALLFGDRRFLERSTVNNFASATLAHSLALSGQHLGIVLLLGCLLARSVALLKPEIFLCTPRSLIALSLGVPLALLYLWLGNSPASLQRAAGMLIFAAIWIHTGKPFSGQDLLCAALTAILLLNPLAAFDPGLQMSALCVGAILLAWPGIVRLLPRENDNRKRYWLNCVFQILAASLIVQIALLPASLARFQLAGFWFALNMIWLPMLGLIVLPCAALGLLLVPLGNPATWALSLACLPCQLMLRILDFLEGKHLFSEPAFMLPHWTALLGYTFLAAGLAWLAANPAAKAPLARGRRFICVTLCLLCIAPAMRIFAILSQRPVIEALDTGQSQAIVVSLPGQIRFLVDGGGSYYNRFDPGKMVVAPALSRNSPPRLSAIFSSHPDLDHLGGLFHILEHLEVGKLFHNGRSAKKGSDEIWRQYQDKNDARILQAGDLVQIGAAEDKLAIEVLHPPDGSLAWKGNGASLILRLVQAGKGLAIFPGDAEKENLGLLVAQNRELSAQVIIAPHHGSDRNVLPAFYEAVNPRLVIACCGYLNRWHYPGKKLQELLARSDASLLDTGNHGRIKVVLGDVPKVTTIKKPLARMAF